MNWLNWIYTIAFVAMGMETAYLSFHLPHWSAHWFVAIGTFGAAVALAIDHYPKAMGEGGEDVD